MLIRTWEYPNKRLELHDDALLYTFYNYPTKRYTATEFWEQECYLLFSPEDMTDAMLLVGEQPLASNASDWARQCYAFWKAFRLDGFDEQTWTFEHPFFLQKPHRLTINRNGVFLTSTTYPTQLHTPLHRFYFRAIGEGDLSVALRQSLWAIIEERLAPHAASFYAHRCICIDYHKIIPQTWRIDHGTESFEELSIYPQRISVGEYWGRDGGGLSISLEAFWYNPKTPNLSNWSDKIADLQSIIQKAIVWDRPHSAPSLDH